MVPYLLIALAGADIILFAWTCVQWRKQPNNMALPLLLLIIIPLTADTGMAGIGAWIGAGETLELITRIRFTMFIAVMPLAILVSLSYLRNADFKWAQASWLLPVAFILVLAISINEAVGAWGKDLYPVCVQGTLRYGLHVPEGHACFAGQEGLGAPSLPLIVMLSTAFMMLTSLALITRGWAWLAIASVAFIVASFIPRDTFGPFFTYPFDAILTATMVLTAIRFKPS